MSSSWPLDPARASSAPSVFAALPVPPLHALPSPAAPATLPHPSLLSTSRAFTQPSAFTVVHPTQSLASAASSALQPPPPRPHHPHVVPLSSSTSSQALGGSAFLAPVAVRPLPSAASTAAAARPPLPSHGQTSAPAAATPSHPIRAQSGPGHTTPFPRVVAGRGRPTASTSSSSSSTTSPSTRSRTAAASRPQPPLTSAQQPPPPPSLCTPVKTSHDKENQPPSAAGASQSPSTPLSLQSSARLLLTLDDEDMYSKVKRRSTVLHPILNSSQPKPPSLLRTPAPTPPPPAPRNVHADVMAAAASVQVKEESGGEVRRRVAERKGGDRMLKTGGKEEAEPVQSANVERPRQLRPLRSSALKQRSHTKQLEGESTSEDDAPMAARPREGEQRRPQARRRKSSSRRPRRRSGTRKPPPSRRHADRSSSSSSSSSSSEEEEKAAGKKRRARRLAPSPSPSPSASPSVSPALSTSAPPRPDLPPVPFAMPTPSLPYLTPVLASSLSELSSSLSSSSFSADFQRRLLSSSSSVSLRCYILCTPASLISRIRFILHRDRSSQKELSRCIGLSPATLSPLLNGHWLSLKLTYFTKMRVWAAQQDVRALIRTVERMRLWGVDEKELMARCGLTELQLSQWLLFDLTMEERSRIDHAIERFMRQSHAALHTLLASLPLLDAELTESRSLCLAVLSLCAPSCSQSVESLLLSTVLSQFEVDYATVRAAGDLDHQSATVLTQLTAQEQAQLPLPASGLYLHDDPPPEQIAFTAIAHYLAPAARPRRSPIPQPQPTEAQPTVRPDSTDDDRGEASGGEGGSDDGGSRRVKREGAAGTVSLPAAGGVQEAGRGRLRVKREEEEQSVQSPSSSVSVKRMRMTTAPQFDLQDDDVPALPTHTPQQSSLALSEPRSGVDPTRKPRTLADLSPPFAARWSPHLTPLTPHAQGGRAAAAGGRGSTFFFFDPQADMAQVAERWGLPPTSTLPSFSSTSSSPSPNPTPARASAGSPLSQAPSSVSSSSSSAMLCTPAAVARRESAADLSLSGLFTPSALFHLDGLDSAQKTAGEVSSASGGSQQMSDTSPAASADVSGASDAPSSMSGASSSTPTLATASMYSAMSTPLTFVKVSMSSTSPEFARGMEPPLARALDLNEGEESSAKQSKATGKRDEVDRSHEWADVMRSLSETPSSRTR